MNHQSAASQLGSVNQVARIIVCNRKLYLLFDGQLFAAFSRVDNGHGNLVEYWKCGSRACRVRLWSSEQIFGIFSPEDEKHNHVPNASAYLNGVDYHVRQLLFAAVTITMDAMPITPPATPPIAPASSSALKQILLNDLQVRRPVDLDSSQGGVVPCSLVTQPVNQQEAAVYAPVWVPPVLSPLVDGVPYSGSNRQIAWIEDYPEPQVTYHPLFAMQLKMYHNSRKCDN